MPPASACHWRTVRARRPAGISHSPTGLLALINALLQPIVNPLSACQTEANLRHLIAEGNRLERRATNIGLLCPKVYTIIILGGIFPLTSPQPKYWWGYVPGIPGGVDASVHDVSVMVCPQRSSINYKHSSLLLFDLLYLLQFN